MATKSQLRKGSKTGSSKELLTSKSDVRARSGGKKRVTMEVFAFYAGIKRFDGRYQCKQSGPGFSI